MFIYVTDQEGNEQKVEGVDGWRLMEVIREYQLPIKAECGGCCECATCHVYVDPEWQGKLPAKTAEENDRLLDDAFELQDNSRLSCQIILNEELDGLKVRLAPGTEPDR